MELPYDEGRDRPLQGKLVVDAAVHRQPRDAGKIVLRSQLVLDGGHATLLPLPDHSLPLVADQEASRAGRSNDFHHRQHFRHFGFRGVLADEVSGLRFVVDITAQEWNDLHDDFESNRFVDDGNPRRLHHARD